MNAALAWSSNTSVSHVMRAIAVAAASFATAVSSLAFARSPEMIDLRTSFIFNFAVYTEWPDERDPVLAVCMIGDDPFGASLDTLAGRQVRGRRIEIRRVRSMNAARRCNMLFIGASELRNAADIVESLRNYSVLTVADFEGALLQGVAICFAEDKDRLRFEVNLSAARSARLFLSSKMLRLAKQVI